MRRHWRLIGKRVALVVSGLLVLLALTATYAHADDGLPVTETEGQEASEKAIIAYLEVHPAAVSPGDTITFSLIIQNQSEITREVEVVVVLPAGLELPLVNLPVGCSYNIRSGEVQWSGIVESSGVRTLNLSGPTPVEAGADGRLTAHVTVVDKSTPDQTVHLSAAGWVGSTPNASFTYQPGPDVRFTNRSEGTGPLSAWWDFGDGSTSNDWSPTHQFPAGGEYTVLLTVANPQGASTTSQQLVVAPQPEIETESYEMLISDDTPAVGQPVYLSNPSEIIPGAIYWNFGDGVTSNLPNPTHIYDTPGHYMVTRVLGEGAMAVQSSHEVIVDYAPKATMDTSSQWVGVGQLITLTADSSAPEISAYYWDFGDGATAVHGYVAHSFAQAGDYLVTLAVSTDFGVALDTLTIQVSPFQHTMYLPLVTNQAEEPDEPTQEPSIPSESELVEEVILDPLAQEMLDAVNAERALNGMPPLRWSGELARSSQHHTGDMAAHWFTGHYGSDGSRPIDRIRQASYTDDYAGECTAWGFDDLASALAWWMTSPPHRVIILSTVATEMGGAYSYNPDSPNKHYWTIDFGASLGE